jgi:hypothetical protein
MVVVFEPLNVTIHEREVIAAVVSSGLHNAPLASCSQAE